MRYKYQAIDAQGQEVSGMLTAEAEREAARQLQRRGLTTLSLMPAEAGVRSTNKTGRAKQRDIMVVLHELTTLLESGVSLIEAVEALANSSHPPVITQVFADIATQLRHGKTFSVALQTSPLKLPWYIVQLVEAGELTGKVAAALRDGVKQMEYEAQVTADMRNAMIYPVILIVSGIAAVLMIFTLVVPRFASILQNRNVDIPWLAQVVLSTGMFLNANFDWIIGTLVVAVIMAAYLFNLPLFRAKVRDAMAKVPLLGSWVLEAETARWAAMMGTLLENRVSLLRALELASQGIKLPSLKARLGQVSKSVRAGISLSQALHENDALTSTGHNLIRAGERAGKLPPMLNSLAKLLEESGRVRMKRFLLLIEPIAILVIGGTIGLIIAGVMLAITSVNEIKF
jgi:general secretion pathway protein F